MNTARLNQGTPLLLNGVTKRYGDNTILNGLDLHIPAGQFVAVVGRSGGGKSTLLRLLAGLEAPNGGDILAGTTPLSNIQDDTRMMFGMHACCRGNRLSTMSGSALRVTGGMKPARRWPPLGWKIAPMNGLPHSRVDRSSALRWRGR